TSGMGLVLGGWGPVVLTGHADASWVDDSATQWSSHGYTFSIGSCSVSWRSTRSSSILSSSCEADIYAGAMAAQELRWLTYLLIDLGEQPHSPPLLYVDNKAMIALCQEHKLEHGTKHIALRYLLARDLQQCGQLCLVYVATWANTADVFTKALPPACFALLDWSCGHLDCHTPSASTSVIAGRGLAAIAEAKREAPPGEGLSHLELETTTRVVFGTKEHPLPGPASQHLRGMNLCDAKRKSFANGALWSRAAHSPGADGAKRSAPPMKGGGEALADGARATLADREPQLAATPADGAPHLAEIEAEPLVVPLGRPPRRTAPVLPPPDIRPRSDPWDTIDWGNEPSTPCRTVYGPAPKPREPTFFPGTIPGTNIPLSTIHDREFLALMLTTANGDNEAEETVAEPAQASDKDPAEAQARYMRTSGFCANDAIWHQRPGHPSRVTLKNCIEAGVFAPGALLRPDGTKVRGATHPRNCTVYPEAALGHQPSPLLEPGTNRYAKLEKVYSDFLNVGHCGINDELYMLTFIDARMHYVWVINVEARSRAYEVFRLWLAHAQRQSREKLKNWQSDGTAEFRSKEMQDYLAQKGIEHHVSLPYAHQQQGVAERTNRTLMTKVRALMKQSKLPPTYWTYAMHHDVRVHNLLSTTAITGNSSPHVKWTGTKGNTSMLRVWGCMVQHCPPTSTIGKFASRARWGIHLGISHEHKAWLILDLMSQKVKNAHDVIFYERLFLRQFREDEQANTNRVYANNGHSYASPENEVAAAILEQDPRGEFTRGDHGDNDDDSLGGGARAAGGGGSGSGRGAAQPAPPEPKSDDDDVQEFIPQHRHDSTVSGLQLLGLHTATSTAPCVIEPKNLCQALTGPHSKEWREAMDAEIKALESCDTWVLVNRAAIKGRRILSGKWMFRVKTAADGTIERFRARWVIRGYDQRHIIDFDQKFAPVSRHTSVRILLAIAAA
ncbi:unnamed protein product, partial [Closterium sp. NIES-53]